jgi:hypothetical protein
MHITMLRDEAYLVGICWQCNEITLVEPKEQGKNLFIKDKYLFSKGCRHCTGNEESNLDWMTIPKEQLKERVLSQVMVSPTKINYSYLIN